MRILNIFLLVGISFISGSLATYVLTVEFPQLGRHAARPVPAAVKKSPEPRQQSPLLPPKVPGTVLEPDPYARTPKAEQPEELLLPRADEASEVIDLLRSEFMDAPALINTQLGEDTLNALMQKIGDKAKISNVSVLGPDPKTKSIAEVLPSGIGYWRVNDFSQKEIESFLKEWSIWKSGDLRGLIVDLRNFRDGNNLRGAAAVASLFVSPQEALFSVEGVNSPQQVLRSQRQPLDLSKNFPITILMNAGTRGSAEALAAALRQKAGAILIGRKSAGEGGLFVEKQLKSGRYLRLATARITAADGSNLLGASLVPDVPVDLSSVSDREGFNAAYRVGISALAAVRMPDRNIMKEKEELDLPLDNAGIDLKSPRDLILSVANDVILGITFSRQRPDGKNG